VLGVLLLLALFLFLFYYLRQRHRKEKIREVHKTESRISKVIHDELANDVFNVMSSIDGKVSIPVIDHLENIYLRTRNISRENSEIDTGENFLAYLKATLANIAPEDTRLFISGETTVKWERLEEEKKIVIYRVLQELMVNMKKHSRASLVAISFAERKNTLEINYSDNGQGVALHKLKKGGGLRNVENRIFSIDGKITFESSAGKGFKANIQVA
jgi:signal transduction histidine kinase